MNNSNGLALLARVRTNSRVTIRTEDGHMMTGPAWRDTKGLPWLATLPNRRVAITESNIVRVQAYD
jgi:hypothetical protein